MKLKNVLLTCIFSIISYVGFCQNISQTISLADSLFQSNNLLQADTIYDRILFFTNDEQQKAILEKSAVCKIYSNKFNEAAFLYKKAINLSNNDSDYFNLLLKKCICHILDNDYDQAKKNLSEIELLCDNELFIAKANYLNGIIEAKNFNYSLAKTSFIKSKVLFNKQDLLLTDSILKRNINAYKPPKKLAQIGSAILPGLGQLISGEYLNAFKSFSINSFLISCLVISGNEYGYLFPSLFFAPFIPKFYLAGIKISGDLATKKSTEINNSFTKEYFKIYFNY